MTITIQPSNFSLKRIIDWLQCLEGSRKLLDLVQNGGNRYQILVQCGASINPLNTIREPCVV